MTGIPEISAAAVATAAGHEAFKLVIKDIYTSLKEISGDKIDAWKAKSTNSRPLYNRINSIRKVKTLLHLDKAVDLTQFYHPLYIKIENARVCVNYFDDFETSSNVLIEGVAGQGKSIFLRHLCIKELNAGKRLPLFIELRNVAFEGSIDKCIEQKFNEYGLTYSVRLFESLCQSGKIILLLDAIDEVPESDQAKAVSYLESLSVKFPDLCILVTCRPDGMLARSPYFIVYRLSGLEGDEYEDVIHKLLSNKVVSEALVASVKRCKTQIVGVLSTPLLVTLLVVTYRSFQEIPTQMAGFYEALFQLLLQRHDGMKPRYRRVRKCKIDDHQYRLVFELFCLFSKEKNKYSAESILGFAKSAIQELTLTESPSEYVEDVVKITCLLLTDGTTYRFIHKSVQEFYAASYFKRSTDAVVRKFYSAMAQAHYGAMMQWDAELDFLREIDTYRYYKYYIIHGIEILSEIHLQENIPDFRLRIIEIGKRSIWNNELTLTRRIKADGDPEPNIEFGANIPALGPFTMLFLSTVFSADLATNMENQLGDALKWKSEESGGKHIERCKTKISELSALSANTQFIDTPIAAWAEKVLTILSQANDYIQKLDNTRAVDGILHRRNINMMNIIHG